MRVIAGKGTRKDLWQLVGYDTDKLPNAVALVERHIQATWTIDCLTRWSNDCAPGLLQAHNPVISAGCLDLLNVANAAVVEAHRVQARRAYD